MFLTNGFTGSPIPSWLLPMFFKLYYHFPLFLQLLLILEMEIKLGFPFT